MSTLSFDEAEALAQRARALLQAARAAAGRDPTGRRQLVAEAMQLVDRALGARDVGVQTLRAAIDALHAQAGDAAAIDWHRVAALYDLLAEIDRSAEVARERAHAHARRRGDAPAQRGQVVRA
jgi:RNA polymerase sigma-70 factor (ECF subfamily)